MYNFMDYACSNFSLSSCLRQIPAKMDPVKLWIIENTAPATAACGVKCFIAKDTDKAEFCIATSICIARRDDTSILRALHIKNVTT